MQKKIIKTNKEKFCKKKFVKKKKIIVPLRFVTMNRKLMKKLIPAPSPFAKFVLLIGFQLLNVIMLWSVGFCEANLLYLKKILTRKTLFIVYYSFLRIYFPLKKKITQHKKGMVSFKISCNTRLHKSYYVIPNVWNLLYNKDNLVWLSFSP